MERYQIGVIGLAVMGKGLALNFAEKGFSVAGYNLEPELTDAFIKESASLHMNTCGFYSYRDFCEALERPRKIFMMVQAGNPVDSVLNAILPFLQSGDIVIDGGNSHFKDTIRRYKHCAESGIHFVGMGVSGGETGARHGPALMPGGDWEVYSRIAPYLTAIAAHVDGAPCCAHIGGDGAGHFLKMVHNGVEYGDMQLICEAYYLIKNVLELEAGEIGAIFTEWNRGELDSYLIEITGDILSARDSETGLPIVDVILGAAGSKGTGKWTIQESLDLGVAIPTISQAVSSRYLSAQTEQRAKASSEFSGKRIPPIVDRGQFLEDVRCALYASKICSYAQGFSMLSASNQAYGWELDLGAIASIFRGGCIIRASLLERISDAFRRDPKLLNLLLDEYFSGILRAYQPQWRRTAALSATYGVATPAMAASLGYFDTFRDAQGPLNLLQAQRDYFGAHTFRRTDREGIFHYIWQ